MSATGRAAWGTYQVIADRLTARIQEGALAAGGPLPSEAALMREYAVSRTTVRRALAVLEAGSLVRTEPGVGRVVATTQERARAPQKTEASFRTIAHNLRQRIADGEFAPGDPLPSETDLQRAYRVSRTTVRAAYSALEGAGLVTAVQGKGRIVTHCPG